MSDDLATKLQHRSADALAYLARYANYLDGVGSGEEAASVNRLRLNLSEVVVTAASTITRLQGESARVKEEWRLALESEILAGITLKIAEAELTRLRAEVETVLAGGREDRERIDALEGRVGVLSEALAPFARHGELFSGDEHDHINVPHIVRDFRRASAALAETKEGQANG